MTHSSVIGRIGYFVGSIHIVLSLLLYSIYLCYSNPYISYSLCYYNTYSAVSVTPSCAVFQYGYLQICWNTYDCDLNCMTFGFPFFKFTLLCNIQKQKQTPLYAQNYMVSEKVQAVKTFVISCWCSWSEFESYEVKIHHSDQG